MKKRGGAALAEVEFKLEPDLISNYQHLFFPCTLLELSHEWNAVRKVYSFSFVTRVLKYWNSDMQNEDKSNLFKNLVLLRFNNFHMSSSLSEEHGYVKWKWKKFYTASWTKLNVKFCFQVLKWTDLQEGNELTFCCFFF